GPRTPPTPRVSPQASRRRSKKKQRIAPLPGNDSRGYGGLTAPRNLSELPAWAMKAIEEDKATKSAKASRQARRLARKTKTKKSRPEEPTQPKVQTRPAEPPKPMRLTKPPTQASDVDSVEQLASRSMPTWSAGGAQERINHQLNEILKEVRAEAA